MLVAAVNDRRTPLVTALDDGDVSFLCDLSLTHLHSQTKRTRKVGVTGKYGTASRFGHVRWAVGW
jgi:hypothetical protein